MTNLTVNEFVKLNHKIGKPEHGLEHYHMADMSNRLSITPLHSKILDGKKHTYLDEAIKQKAHVPNKYYDVAGDFLSP
jgi:hypothetical protein